MGSAPGHSPRTPSKRAIATLFIALSAIVCAWQPVAAQTQAQPLQRHVLAIYDSRSERNPSDTMVHLRAEMPLNYLGYIVDYQDAANGLPDPVTMPKYSAVVTWFTYDLVDPSDYLSWARKVSERRIPFIIFGGIGVPTTSQNIALFNRILEPMGISYTTSYVESTLGTKILRNDPAVVGFERPLDALLPSYPIIRRISDDAQVALEVQAPRRELNATSALVTAGLGGAFVPAQFALYIDANLHRAQWVVNPFEIFERTLGRNLQPIPDTTTVSGRRLYFSQIDGDGWNDNVEMERFRDPPVPASQIMLQALIAPYPDLPVTVGVVGADLDQVLGGGDKAVETARQIFALPQVEIASHTRTAPIDWSFYEHYSRADEERLIHGEEVDSGPTLVNEIAATLGLMKSPSSTEGMRARYLSGARALPRAFLRDPFSIATEVDGAVAELNALAPAGKQVTLYQWTGDAKPFAEVIGATRKIGLRNINGGGSRFDDDYPSVGYTTPISRTIGDERQIYAVAANENTFTSEWTDNFGGFADLKETLSNSESPRRLSGANIYYHAYSAKTQASLSAVAKLLDWARGSKLAPITTSNYAAIADGFFSTQVDQLGPLTWRIGNRDGLQTVRFDHTADLDIDLDSSVGVVGSTVANGSLYVALDAAVPEAIVSLRSGALPRSEREGTTRIALEGGRWQVLGMERSRCGATFDATGFGSSQFEWRNLAEGSYQIEARRGASLLWQAQLRVAVDGKLTFDAPLDAIVPVHFSISCDLTGRAS